MLEILERICGGEGQEGDIERLIELGSHIQETALCGLGQTAPNPVLSTIRHFRKEYEEHIRDHHCDAGVCPELVRAPCQSACPASVDIPGFVLIGRRRPLFGGIETAQRTESFCFCLCPGLLSYLRRSLQALLIRRFCVHPGYQAISGGSGN